MYRSIRGYAVLALALTVLAGCSQLLPAPESSDSLIPQASCSPSITMDRTIELLRDNGRLSEDQWALAGAIAKAESQLCLGATHPNTDGSIDRGLFQVNSVHGYSTSCLFDGACNVEAAMYVYGMQGWNAWTVYRENLYQPHLNEARAAVARVSGGSTSATGTTANQGEYAGPYNLRNGPGTNHGVVGSVKGGVNVTIVCQATGTSHTGPWGATNIWDKLSTGGWISDAFVYTGSNSTVAPPCG